MDRRRTERGQKQGRGTHLASLADPDPQLVLTSRLWAPLSNMNTLSLSLGSPQKSLWHEANSTEVLLPRTMIHEYEGPGHPGLCLQPCESGKRQAGSLSTHGALVPTA